MRPLLLLLAACSTTAAPTPPEPATPAAPPAAVQLTFDALAAPTGDTEKATMRVTTGFTLGGAHHELKLQTLMRGGDVIGGVPYGQLLDARGAPLVDDAGKPVDCGGADFAGLWQAQGGLFLIQHIECVPSAMYLTTLNQSAEGLLTATATRNIDLSGVGGAINACAGQITSWGTHLASEEYDIDARVITNGQVDPAKDTYNWRYMARYLGVAPQNVDPYDYGWTPEVTLKDAQGTTAVVKHTAMGRFSHEVAVVLPDERTVYLSDDTTAGGGLFLFIADRAKDLSAGTLYAAQWKVRDARKNIYSLSWVNLGHASDLEVDSFVKSRRTMFTDLFETAEPADATCPAGFTSIYSTTGHECLKLKPGMELPASRLETRRYAAYKGATTELEKGEGIVFDPRSGTLFFTSSKVSGPMRAADAKTELGGPDQMRMTENACGMVWAISTTEGIDTQGQNIASRNVGGMATVATAGRVASYTAQPERERNACDIDAIANPDNLAFIPEAGLLIIAEDSKLHENMNLWALDPATGALSRLITTPWGGELTGIQWFPNIGGKGYLTVTVQHPFEQRFLPPGKTAPPGETRTITGVLGPFPPIK